MKLKIKIILIQCLGIVFLINGIQRIYFASQFEKFNCYILSFENQESECWKKLMKNETFGDFLSNIYLWFFYGFIIGIILIACLNWKSKISQLNSVIVFTLMFLLFPIGFFRNQIVAKAFNSFGALFSNDFGMQNLIGGISFTLIGITILLNNNKLK